MKTVHLLLFTMLSFAFWSCSSSSTKTENNNEEPEITVEEEIQEETTILKANKLKAKIHKVNCNILNKNSLF